jgi:hypothetical protein
LIEILFLEEIIGAGFINGNSPRISDVLPRIFTYSPQLAGQIVIMRGKLDRNKLMLTA